MNEIIPFKKDILFKTRINEITDIMLEHDYKIMSDIIDGDFILSGSYKMTEASVINEDFFYKIPFSIAINEDILKETIDLTIKDFKYEIVNSDMLKMDISLALKCEVAEPTEEEDEIVGSIEEVLEESEDIEFDEISERNEEDTYEETATEELIKEEVIETEPEKETKSIQEIMEKEIEIKEIQEKMTEQEINEITESVKEKNDYVTYKVYLAKENDTFESISAKYEIDLNEIRKYNNEDLYPGDKIIIPYTFNDK